MRNPDPSTLLGPQDREFLAVLHSELLEKLRRDNAARRVHADDAKIRSDVDTMLSVDYECWKLGVVERDTGLDLEKKRLLELGSGLGFFVVVARRLGVEAHGVEPFSDFYDEDRAFAARLRGHFCIGPEVLREVAAERLPFPDDSFDVVTSYYAFEHVADPLAALRESLRVVRPGGFIHAVFPNYGSFWEGHYAVPWIPNLNRRWGGRYVRWVWKRSPHIVEHLNLLNERDVRRLVERLGSRARCVGLGREVFEREISTLSFDTTGSIQRVRWFFLALKRTGLLRLFARTLSALRLYTPFYLTIAKLPA